jgi:TRAP-type C4-dicarboxylate transport system permease small subunit
MENELSIATKLGIALGLLVLCMLPIYLMVEGAWRQTKQEEQRAFTLRLPMGQVVVSGFLCSIPAVLATALLWAPVVLDASYWWVSMCLVPVAFFLAFPLLLFINHLLQTLSQTVSLDKDQQQLVIEKSGQRHQIHLAQDQYQVVRYERNKENRRSFRRPMMDDFEKTVLVQGDKRIEFSEMLLFNYPSLLELLEQHADISVKRVKYSFMNL